jgi:hypothetical protein
VNKLIIALLISGTVSLSALAGEIMQKPKSPLTHDQKISLITEMAEAFGKKVDPNDPKTIQAAEAFIVTDAGKAYAFTKVYAVPLEFCNDNSELIAAKNKYMESAKDIIRLGEYYYTHGFSLTLGDKAIAKTGEELTEGLEKMLGGIRTELNGSDKKKISKKCSESIEAFNSLAKLYGG